MRSDTKRSNMKHRQFNNLHLFKHEIQNDTTKPSDLWLYTLPTTELLGSKNVQAWVSMVLYLKNEN